MTETSNSGPGALLGPLGKRLKLAETAVQDALVTAEELRAELVSLEQEASADGLRDAKVIRGLEEQLANSEVVYQKETARLKEKISELAREIVLADERLAEADTEIKDALAAKELSRMRTLKAREELDSAAEGFQGTESEYLAQIEALHTDLADARRSLGDATEALEQEKELRINETRSLKLVVDELEARVEQLDHDLSHEHREHLRLTKEAEEANEQLKLQLEMARGEVVRLNVELSQKTDDSEAADAAAEANRVSSLELALVTATSEVERLKKLVESREASLATAIESAKQEKELAVAALQAEVRDAKHQSASEITLAHEALAELKQDHAALTKKLFESSRYQSELVAEIDGLKKKLEDSSEALSTTSATVAQKDAAIAVAERARDELSTRLAEAELTIRRLGDQLEAKAESNTRAEALARLGQEE